MESLRAYLGLTWTLGCVLFGLIVTRKNSECSIARQYLAQASLFVCGVSIMALTQVQGNSGYMIFIIVYGTFLGGYNYSLKMYLFEKVRARNFAYAWGFVQFSQAFSIGIGVPITGYINIGCDSKAGYYFSAVCVMAGAVTLFLIDVHKRNIRSRRKMKCLKKSGSKVSQEPIEENLPKEEIFLYDEERRNSFADVDDEFYPPFNMRKSYSYEDIGDLKKVEVTCISEEGIVDIGLPENLLDELEILENITSCNKVENYLMLSEFEQNLSNLSSEKESPVSKRGKKSSLTRQQNLEQDANHVECRKVGSGLSGTKEIKKRGRDIKSFKSPWKNEGSKRTITTIDEDSV